MSSFDSEALRQDFFSLFGLPRQQGLDVDRLEQLYRDIQAKVHPDKHAYLSDSEKRLAMQWSTHVNEAYQTLKDPLKRARYLLKLAGHDVRLETNTAMPTEFLVEQMELREAVIDARDAGDADALDVLHRRLKKDIRAEYTLLQQTFDANMLERAGELVRQLMFQEKLIQEVDDALEVIER
ncbi:MAG: Fe-S protein assembly co-chaperone HscB [Gammaproteobacteria bacterium]|nr:Fe-S protein assembly co-chaperone HscB [Rhodocyclaceae bacterium]MBU3908842.1 Fe-S protein assembly co-chaperone HscB [Gammaproteobacteria bacterium]MBU3987709.1 Fe-S protein assembly co-chaperone HscB [Gammaproteobacteria bacterium]MBU4003677.1 Fe-S protein assembly co-chaperone HscB [Gammaproteobacteria bacterium]MBU4021791.1 Fe-S protein assembly co-chaperone HscB [Gammaproteobacteria bacterium]